MPRRRDLLAGGAAVALAAPAVLAPRPARAAWPEDRPIEVIVPFPPGGGVDTMARAVLPHLQARLPGSRFVVVNRAGAGGQVGFEATYNAAPDGFTLGATTSPALVTFPLERAVRYDFARFAYLANVVDDPGGLFVGSASPLRGLGDLVAAARARPGALSYGTTGVGSDDHLLVLALEAELGLPPMNHVPFNGSAQLFGAVLGGQLDLASFNMSEGLGQLRDGRMRALGQAAASRWAGTPEVPTFAEGGVAVVGGAQRGLVGPPGLPEPIRARLERALAEALADPAFLRDAERLGLPVRVLVGEAYRAEVARQEATYRALWARRPWREG